MLATFILYSFLWMRPGQVHSYPDDEVVTWNLNNGRSNLNVTNDWICSHSILESLATIIKTLNWTDANMIYESRDDEMLMNITRYFDDKNHLGFKTTIYEVLQLDSSTLMDILKTIYLKRNTYVRIILLLRSRTFELLRMADTFDEYSNKTTNYETNSRWIILSPVKDLFDFHLRNVLILSCHGNHGVYLSSVAERRSPTRINCSSQDDTCMNSPEPPNTSDSLLFPNIKYKFNRRHLIIGTVVSKFLQINVNEKNETVYTGLTVELAELLADSLNCTFTFELPVDSDYGSKKENGDWTGMVGQLYRKEVDIVIADLVTTEDRTTVVDFIFPPFFVGSWGALYRTGIDMGVKWIKIFRPFQGYVYLTMLAATVLVAMGIYVLAVYCNGSPRGEGMGDIMFRMLNIIISVFGVLFVRGDGMETKQMSVRVLLVSFSMFSVVLAGIYVGNLTASLTDIKFKRPFNNLEELVELTDWKWGIRGFDLYKTVMKQSKNPMIKRLWTGLVEFNKTDPSTFEMDMDFHIKKVLKPGEKYVFITADSKYELSKRHICNLKIIDEIYSNLPIAIAVSKDSYLKPDLELTMSKLSDNGFVRYLTQRLYTDNRQPPCKISEDKRSFHLDDILGAFVVALIGLAITLIVLLIEILSRYV
ncbi:hypothetical protein SNE40_016516 [Patella caerulea]|uniref:Uncharacterized protein n=1 Tax=Patella caerulea TaxID=87958 RepID=A0AAN8JDE9_PATCE